LNNLRKNKNIIIKKADKNSGIVIMNATDYENKVTNMLTDDTFYNIIQEDDTDLVKYKSNELLKQIHEKGYLDNKQLRHLSAYKAQLPIFYGFL